MTIGFCLVLDSTWQASHVVSIREAFLLLFTGKAIPVTDTTIGVMRSPSMEFPVPAIIQVATAIRAVFKAPGVSTRRILARDDHTCQFVIDGKPCKERATTVDHLVPKSKGGKDTWENLVAACKRHNSIKDDFFMEEMKMKFNWTIRRKPLAPRFMMIPIPRHVERHPEWDYFLNLNIK